MKDDGHGGFIPDGDKKTFVEYLKDIPCRLEPLTANFSQDINVGFGKDLILYCGDIDIIEGDRVKHNGYEYRVTGVKEYRAYNENDHKKVTIRIFDNE